MGAAKALVKFLQAPAIEPALKVKRLQAVNRHDLSVATERPRWAGQRANR